MRSRCPVLVSAETFLSLTPSHVITQFCSMHACVLTSSGEDISHGGVGPAQGPRFNSVTFSKGPVSKHSHFVRCWEFGLQHRRFEGTQFRARQC